MNRPLAGEVFLVMLKLGCLAFGGPVAHLALYQREFVEKRRWVSAEEFADLIGFCSFLPGPASSQVGMSLGFLRAGLSGMFAAWLGFCLPSVLLLFAVAVGLAQVSSDGSGWLGGLLAGVVAIVAEAVWKMGQKLCPDNLTKTLALLAACGVLLFASPWTQVVVITLGAMGGLLAIPPVHSVSSQSRSGVPSKSRMSVPWRSVGFGWAILVLALVIPVMLAHSGSYREISPLSIYAGFCQTGALVFGGGHVVLPMLEAVVVEPGWLSDEQFLTGYGLTQAMPGPIFTLSAYLGAVIGENYSGDLIASMQFAALAFVGIFAPSLGFVAGLLPFWHRIRSWTRVRQALSGINAAVVGLLIAALYDPVWTKAQSHNELGLGAALTLLSWTLLVVAKRPAWLVLLVAAALGYGLSLSPEWLHT